MGTCINTSYVQYMYCNFGTKIGYTTRTSGQAVSTEKCILLSSKQGACVGWSSRTSGHNHCRLDKKSEKCISLLYLRVRRETFLSRTRRTNGKNYSQLDKITCRREKCISLTKSRNKCTTQKYISFYNPLAESSALNMNILGSIPSDLLKLGVSWLEFFKGVTYVSAEKSC